MPLWLVGLLGAAVGVGVYELAVRPLVAPALGLNPQPPAPQPVAAGAPPQAPFPTALGHLTHTTAGSEALARSAIAQARGRR